MSGTAGSPPPGGTPAGGQPSPGPPADQPPGTLPPGRLDMVYPATVSGRHAHRRPLPPSADRARRSLAERLGMAAVALVMTTFFAAVSLGSLAGGDWLQGIMAALGALLSAWVGLLTVRRG